jgi:hypothetical protein
MAMGATPAAGAAAAAAVRQSCEASGGYSDVELHVARLEDVYASDEQRRDAAAVQQADSSALDARQAKLQTLLKVHFSCQGTAQRRLLIFTVAPCFPAESSRKPVGL